MWLKEMEIDGGLCIIKKITGGNVFGILNVGYVLFHVSYACPILHSRRNIS